jgi:hypothetical protein
MELKQGQRVLYGKYSGAEVTLDDQEGEGLIRRRQELWRDLEELASSSVPVNTSQLQARRNRRERITDELDEIETHFADLNADERNIGSMEGRE